jgi:hypothetical protein
MPFAQVFAPAEVLSLEQKRAMVKGITEVMVKVEKMPLRPALCDRADHRSPRQGLGSPATAMCCRNSADHEGREQIPTFPNSGTPRVLSTGMNCSKRRASACRGTR